jgi:hypothetical protein
MHRNIVKTVKPVALALAAVMVLVPIGDTAFVGHAWAEDSGSGGSGRMQQGKTGVHGHEGAAGPGSSRGQAGVSGNTTGQRGPSSDSDSVGPRYQGSAESRQPSEGTQGGRPVWAKEGIPAVELGRLSVARSPASVLQHAYDETVANWSTIGPTVLTLKHEDGTTYTMTVAELYSLSAEQFASVIKLNYEAVTRIDSPLENLALLKDIVADGKVGLTGVTPASTDDLAAIFLGSASDKELKVSADTVIAVYTILGLPVPTAAEAATVATSADSVRLAILAGHG